MTPRINYADSLMTLDSPDVIIRKSIKSANHDILFACLSTYCPGMGTENIWKNWLASPLGQKLLAEEKDWFDKNLEDIFGYHAVQICPYSFDSLSNNRIVYKYRFSFGLCEGLIDEQIMFL